MKKQKGFRFLTAVAFLGCLFSAGILRAETVQASEEAKMPVAQAKEWIRILYDKDAEQKIDAFDRGLIEQGVIQDDASQVPVSAVLEFLQDQRNPGLGDGGIRQPGDNHAGQPLGGNPSFSSTSERKVGGGSGERPGLGSAPQNDSGGMIVGGVPKRSVKTPHIGDIKSDFGARIGGGNNPLAAEAEGEGKGPDEGKKTDLKGGGDYGEKAPKGGVTFTPGRDQPANAPGTAQPTPQQNNGVTFTGGRDQAPAPGSSQPVRHENPGVTFTPGRDQQPVPGIINPTPHAGRYVEGTDGTWRFIPHRPGTTPHPDAATPHPDAIPNPEATPNPDAFAP